MKSKVVIVATIIGSLLLMPIAGFAESDVDECKKLSGEAAVAIAKREEWNADVAVSQMKKKCAHIQHYAEMAVFYQGKIDRDLRSPATPSAVAEVPVMRRGAGSGTSIIADAAARTSRGESVDLPLPTVAESNDSVDWIGMAAQVAQAAAQQNLQRQNAMALADQRVLRQQQIAQAQAQQTMPNQPSPQASYQQWPSHSQGTRQQSSSQSNDSNSRSNSSGTTRYAENPVTSGGAPCAAVAKLGSTNKTGISQTYVRHEYRITNSCGTPVRVTLTTNAGWESSSQRIQGGQERIWFCTDGFRANTDCQGGIRGFVTTLSQ